MMSSHESKDDRKGWKSQHQQPPPPPEDEDDNDEGLRVPLDFITDDVEVLRAELAMLQTPASQDYRDATYIMLQNIRSECSNDFTTYCSNNAYESLFNFEEADPSILFVSPDSPFFVFNEFTNERRRSLRADTEIPFHQKMLNDIHRTIFTPFFSGPLGTVFDKPAVVPGHAVERETPIQAGIHHGGVIVGLPPKEADVIKPDTVTTTNKPGSEGHGVFRPPQPKDRVLDLLSGRPLRANPIIRHGGVISKPIPGVSSDAFNKPMPGANGHGIFKLPITKEILEKSASTLHTMVGENGHGVYKPPAETPKTSRKLLWRGNKDGDSDSDSGSDSDSDGEEDEGPPPPHHGCGHVREDTYFMGSLSFGYSGDACMYENFQTLSPGCQEAVSDLYLLRESYWQQEEIAHKPPHHGGFMILPIILLFVAVPCLVRKLFIKRKRIQDVRKVLAAIEANPALKKQVEEAAGIAVPKLPECPMHRARSGSCCGAILKFIAVFIVSVIIAVLVLVVSTQLVMLLNHSPDHSVNVTKILIVYFLLSVLVVVLAKVAFSTMRRISTIERENRNDNSNIQEAGQAGQAGQSVSQPRRSTSGYVYNNILSMIGQQRNADDYTLLPAEETEMVATTNFQASAPTAITITQFPAQSARPVTNINII